MKITLRMCLPILLLSNLLFATTNKIEPSESIQIFGKIKSPKIITIAELSALPQKKIANQIIYNHSGEIRDTLTNLKVIAVKDVLQRIEFSYEKPKELNEFYFIFTATDGYKVVFSWNEIFNTEIGNQLFIIAEMGEKKMNELEERIMILSAADIKSGRRFIKGLQKIEVKRAD